ncbi:hypothetical protein [Cetobacterium sp. 2A]|nr:hypothetical protein [Cetobacterium sp. 2A]
MESIPKIIETFDGTSFLTKISIIIILMIMMPIIRLVKKNKILIL